MQNNIPGVGYVRVSTLKQSEEGVSLEQQEAKIRAYADLHNITLVDIFHENTDESGKQTKASAKSLTSRPKARQAIEMVVKKEVDCLIVYKLDRLVRNTSDALIESKRIDKAGGSLHSVTESINTKSAMGKFFFTLLSAIADMERDLIGERTRDALRHKRSTGQTFNHSPLGYISIEGKLVRDEKEQSTINTIMELRGKGSSYQSIASTLNSQGILSKKGGTWYSSTIKKIVDR